MYTGLLKLLLVACSLVGGADQYGLNLPKTLSLKSGDQIAAIGDSITEAGGFLKDVDSVLAAAYPDLKLPVVFNVGVSHQKAEDLADRFEHDVVHAHLPGGRPVLPAIAIISIGINDVWQRIDKPHDPSVLAAYKANVARMVDIGQAAGMKVILLTPTLIKEDANSPENDRLRLYVEAEKQIALDKHCVLIDLHQMFLDALNKRPANVPDRQHWLTVDGIHMTPLGDAVMAVGVLRGLGVPDTALRDSRKANVVH